jgi:hypothetical protein
MVEDTSMAKDYSDNIRDDLPSDEKIQAIHWAAVKSHKDWEDLVIFCTPASTRPLPPACTPTTSIPQRFALCV